MFILPFLLCPGTAVTTTRPKKAHLLLVGGTLWEEPLSLEDITPLLASNDLRSLHLHYDPARDIVFASLDPTTSLDDYYQWHELPLGDERFAWRTFYDLPVPPTETIGPFALRELLHDVFKPDTR